MLIGRGAEQNHGIQLDVWIQKGESETGCHRDHQRHRLPVVDGKLFATPGALCSKGAVGDQEGRAAVAGEG